MKQLVISISDKTYRDLVNGLYFQQKVFQGYKLNQRRESIESYVASIISLGNDEQIKKNKEILEKGNLENG